MKYLKVDAILLNAAGKIETIRVWDEISHTNKSYTVDELLSSNEIMLSNLKIQSDRTVLVTAEEYNKIQISSNKFNCNSLEIQFDVINVIYETRYVRCLDDELMISKIVLAVDIKCNNQLQFDYLHSIGGKDLGNKVIRVTAVQIRHMIYNNSSVEKRFKTFGIIISAINNNMIFLDNEYYKVSSQEDNTNRARLEHWITKSSVMGISKDYNISLMESKLTEYSGKDRSPVLPPVRIIGDYAFDRDNNIEILNIPNSVEVIKARLGYLNNTLKEINFGDNVHSLINDSDNLNCLFGLSEIDFKNIIEIPNLSRIGFIPKIKANIRAEFIGITFTLVGSTMLELRE